MVGKAHCETLKGRVGLTVTKIRSSFGSQICNRCQIKSLLDAMVARNLDQQYFDDQLPESYPKTEQKVIDHSKW